jgi:hypothetical protein
MLKATERYYGGGRGGYTGVRSGAGDRYTGGGRGGYTVRVNVERRTGNTEHETVNRERSA